MKNRLKLLQPIDVGVESKIIGLVFGALCSFTVALSANPKEKILVFPNEHSYGTLSKITSMKPLELRVQKLPLGEAKGTIKLPANVRVCYEPGPKFFRNPQILLKFSPDSIEYIKMKFTPMEDNEESMSDHAVEFVSHLRGLHIVDFDKSDTTDAGAAKLAGMPNLTGISSSESLITGTCFKSLSTCPKLEVMRIGSVQISNESLRFLKDFKNLKRMDLTRVGLNSEGIEHLAKCKTLTYLDIASNPKLTGKDLAKLMALKKLKVINLRNNHISIPEIKAFANNRKIAVIMPRMLAQYSKQDQAEAKKIHADLRFDFDSKPINPDINTIFGTVNRK